VIEELLRYLYTDHVDNLDTLASELLTLALRFRLQGLIQLVVINTNRNANILRLFSLQE
jgi:hypothetical protein